MLWVLQQNTRGVIPNNCTTLGSALQALYEFVIPFVVNKNAHKLLNHMVYFDQILHANACQHDLATGMCNSLFLMDEALLSTISVGFGQ